MSASSIIRIIAPTLLLIWSCCSSAVTAVPQLQAQPLTTAPVLDGDVLNDSAWRDAPAATGLTQSRPFAGERASQRSQIYIGFTKDTLYVAAVLHDDEPSRIVTGDSRRDSDINETDSFQMIIDGFRDRQNGLFFGTSPAGVQFDAQVVKEGNDGGFNINWDTSWEVETKIGDFGWSLEMAIPFRVLRYGAGEIQSWGINFQRNIRRNKEVAYWAPLSRQHGLTRVSDAGVLNNLSVPQQRSLKLTPYALGRIESGGLAGSGSRSDSEFGLDVKYTITPSLTLDATYNTDFAQVEADELQVNLDRFSLFFPEKRTFFLENAGQFSVGTPQEVELFFSRRIGVGVGGTQQPIDGGLRLSGKIGANTNIGLLHMRTDAVQNVLDENAYSVARINQEIGDRSTLGAIYVARDGERSGDYNRTYAIDGRWGMGRYNRLEGYVAQTETPGRRGDDQAYRLRYGHSSRDWTGVLGYTKVGENFNPEVGFLARKNYEKADFVILRRYRPNDLFGLHELRPHIGYRGYFDDEGFYESGWLHIDNHWEWRTGHEVHTGVNFTREGVKEAFEINEGVFVPPGEYDHKELDLKMWSNKGANFSAQLDVRSGGFFGGDRLSLAPSITWRAGETFSGELRWNYNDIDLPVANGDFEVNVASLRLSYSFTPKVLLQALVQHDDRSDLIATNLRFSWLQSARTGLYLVYNEVDDDSVGGPIKKRREFVLKYSHIFDI